MEQPMIFDNKPPAENDKPSKEGPKKKTVLSIWKDFGDNTSMHGLGRAINSKRVWKRLVWALLVICAASVASYNLYQTIADYLTFPVKTNIELDPRPRMEFPAVTICNLNPARKSYLHPKVQEVLNASIARGDRPERQERLFRMRYSEFYEYVTFDNVTDPVYNISDMIVDCRFDLSSCNAEEDFESFDNFKYKKCFSFNAGFEPRMVQRAGNTNGLILELDIQQDEYLPFVSTTGISVLVHAPNQMPFPEDSGIIVSPGRATSIGIRKTSVVRQPPPWGACVDGENVDNEKINMFGKDYKYTAAVCEKTCYQRSVYTRCRCCDANFPCGEDALEKITGIRLKKGYIPDCDESIKEDMKCLESVRNEYFSGYLPCMEKCRPACKETMYETMYATGDWPGENFKANLEAKAKRSIKSKQKSFQAYPDPLTNEFISKNFLRLEVYFQNFVEEKIVTNPAYDWNKFISDIGGQLGLWLGFSLMTAVEIIELFFDIFSFICRKVTKS